MNLGRIEANLSGDELVTIFWLKMSVLRSAIDGQFLTENKCKKRNQANQVAFLRLI